MKTLQDRMREIQAKIDKQAKILAAKKQIEDGRKALAALRNHRRK